MFPLVVAVPIWEIAVFAGCLLVLTFAGPGRLR
jgi:hypothetical protein